MIFLGEQVDPTAYNRVLFREGRGFMPAEIARYREEEAAGLILESFSDSPLAPLTKLKSQALSKIRPKRFAEVSVAADAGDAVRVLARWNDSRQSPAIVEKRIGEGRVLLWTITADKKWSDWPTDGSYVLAVRQAAMAIAAHSTDRDNVIAGQPLRYRLDKKGIPLQAGVKPPAARSRRLSRSTSRIPNLRSFITTRRHGPAFIAWIGRTRCWEACRDCSRPVPTCGRAISPRSAGTI